MQSEALQRARAAAKARREASGVRTEEERIKTLPTQDFVRRPDLVRKWTEALRRTQDARPLRYVQAEILETGAWSANNTSTAGIFGNVAVGGGKTLALFLLPEVMGAENAVLFLDPAMRIQYESDLFEWSQEYKFTPPTVVYYSELSQPGATDLLRRLNPDLIMADEAQNLKNPTAARTKRFHRYMHESPDTRFVALTGTSTTSGLADYAHLMVLALRELAPLPLSTNMQEVWASILDSDIDASPDDAAWAQLRWLDPVAASDRDRGAMRKAFFDLKQRTAGTVHTRASSCDARLEITAVFPALSQEVKDAVSEAVEDFTLPDGSPLIDALQAHAAATQLSSGFYYVWDWPEDKVDLEWVEARSEWGKACRNFLTYRSREGVDSPHLLERHLLTHGPRVDATAHAALMKWLAQKDKPTPPTRPVWLDSSPVEWAIEWLESRERGFIWFQNRAVGELLEAYGIPTFWSGMPDPEKHARCALSINVYHKGMNFQPWADQLVLEPMPNAATWEQLLGRQHRSGQLSPVVKCSVAQQTWPLQVRMRKALTRAAYIQESTGQPQKLLLANKTGFIR